MARPADDGEKLAPPLFCDTCHSRWIEQCFNPFDRCPYVDCAGVLTRAAPEPLQPKPREPKPKPTTPLLDGAAPASRSSHRV